MIRLTQKGSSVAIVLIVILLMGMIISTLMFTNRSSRKERSIIEKNIKLFYIAESGINHAFHMLLKSDYNNRFYAPATQGEVTGDCGNGSYTVTLKNIVYDNRSAVKIRSNGSLDGKNKTLQAIAVFNHSRRIKMYCTYYCDEEVTEEWVLKYTIQ